MSNQPFVALSYKAKHEHVELTGEKLIDWLEHITLFYIDHPSIGWRSCPSTCLASIIYQIYRKETRIHVFVCIQRDWSSIKAFDLVGQNGKDKKRDGEGKKEKTKEKRHLSGLWGRWNFRGRRVVFFSPLYTESDFDLLLFSFRGKKTKDSFFSSLNNISRVSTSSQLQSSRKERKENTRRERIYTERKTGGWKSSNAPRDELAHNNNHLPSVRETEAKSPSLFSEGK